mgnify:CR=1 FL=1
MLSNGLPGSGQQFYIEKEKHPPRTVGVFLIKYTQDTVTRYMRKYGSEVDEKEDNNAEGARFRWSLWHSNNKVLLCDKLLTRVTVLLYDPLLVAT